MTAPVFVFGALRSGTTLFRLMLNSHPDLHNPGEVDFLFDFLRPDPGHATGWRYDIDQMRTNRVFQARGLRLPEGRDGLDLLGDMIAELRARHPGVLSLNVHRHADRIAATLPGARFVHLVRDPRDVARSGIGMGWSGISYFGIDHWIGTERHWDRAAIDPAAVLELRFETLMGNIETELQRICAFMDVPFAPAMLEYHHNTTYGPPDPAIAQAWKHKATPHEVALMEGKCADLLVARGYALNGIPVDPGALERRGLWIRDRLRRWRFNINRFGLPLFLMSQISRHLRSGRFRDHVRKRLDAKTTEVLK